MARSDVGRAVDLWRATYGHGRRAHRHRCRVCNRIIDTGEAVWMARTAWKVTKAIHEACADRRAGSVSAVELLGMHAASYRDRSLSDAQSLALSQATIASALDAAQGHEGDHQLDRHEPL